ncbi:MAG: hypothetical protein J07HQX50_01004 [Haloquadratum sp. J07HQX50]|nr:MAG: hypothetical protein J07HQX50_01004 [Haloquadratum sp. J07HQX50]
MRSQVASLTSRRSTVPPSVLCSACRRVKAAIPPARGRTTVMQSTRYNTEMNAAKNIHLDMNIENHAESSGQSQYWLAQPGIYLHELSSELQSQEPVVDCHASYPTLKISPPSDDEYVSLDIACLRPHSAIENMKRGWDTSYCYAKCAAYDWVQIEYWCEQVSADKSDRIKHHSENDKLLCERFRPEPLCYRINHI